MNIQLLLILVYLCGFILRVIACLRIYTEKVTYYSKYPEFFNFWSTPPPTKKELIISMIFSVLWPLIILIFPFYPKSFFSYFHIGKSVVVEKYEKHVQEEHNKKVEIDIWLANNTATKYINYSSKFDSEGIGQFIFSTSLLKELIKDESNPILKWAQGLNENILTPVEYPKFGSDIKLEVYELALKHTARIYCPSCKKEVKKLKDGGSGGFTDGNGHLKGQTYDALYCENDHLLLRGKEGPRFF